MLKVSLELLAFAYHGHDHQGNLVTYSVNGEPTEDGEPTVKFTKDALTGIAKTYGDVAEAALECSFDMLCVHAGHGLCMSQFLSKFINQRDDEFGGSIENRMRFVDMVLDEIRARVGHKLLIELRISGDEMFKKPGVGYKVDECIEMLKYVQDKIDIARVSNGMFFSGPGNITRPTEFLPEGVNSYLAKAVKACPDIHIPVLTLGAFQNPDKVEQVLADGTADLVGMTRGLISDAARVNKWRDGKEDDCIPCIRCLHCLDYSRAPIFSCSVNPTVGRESRQPFFCEPVGEKKKVVIVVGGLVGSETALHLTLDKGYAGKGTLVEMTDKVATDEMHLTQEAMIERMDETMTYLTNATCTAITEQGLTYKDAEGTEHQVAADTVIIAAGMRARLDEAMSFAGCAREWEQIGDYIAPSNVRNAVRTGYDAANRI